MERKSSKEYSVVFLLEGEKFKLWIFLRGVHLFCRFCCELGWHNAWVHDHRIFAAVLTPNLAELVPSGFFCPQPWFLRRSEHIFPGKTPVFTRVRVAIDKQLAYWHVKRHKYRNQHILCRHCHFKKQNCNGWSLWSGWCGIRFPMVSGGHELLSIFYAFHDHIRHI